MEKGDILGHEPMGVVVEVGRDVTKLNIGDRVVVPVHDLLRQVFLLPEGSLLLLRHDKPERRSGQQGDGTLARGALRLFASCSGGFPADRPSICAFRTPTSAPSRSRMVFRTRRCSSFPTSSRRATWPPRTPQIEPGDTVAVWGCGPVGQFAIQSAWMFGAGRVIAIDRVPERLRMARSISKAETINFDNEKVYDRLMEMTKGRGPDRCIDAVGAESHVSCKVESIP